MEGFINALGEAFYIFITAFVHIFKDRVKTKHFIDRLVYIGADTVPVVFITSMFTGGVLALQTYSTLHKFNSEYLIGALVALSMGRELGPVLTSLMVVARVGSAITASIGTMKVTEQIDALETLAINPYSYLTSPILFAFMIDVPLLTIISDISGIAGGYLVSTFIFHINGHMYWDKTKEIVDFYDIYGGLYKSFVYGIVIATVSNYFGFKTTGGNQGVGRATTSSVVVSSMLILTLDYFLTAIIYR